MAAVLLIAIHTPGHTKTPSVVASIKPVHSLVTALMTGVGQPHLLIKGTGSPHAYSLKPSDARRLSGAKLIFWIGEDMEAFLTKPLKALAGKATAIELSEIKGLLRLKTRKGGVLPAHDDHAEHGKADAHDKDHKGGGHKKEDHDEEGHDGHDKKGHDKKEHGHAHGDVDMHLWLDPRNAAAMARAMADALIKADPAHRSDYERNRALLLARLATLEKTLARKIKPIQSASYVTFHDAYQYFEHRFHLKNVAVITVNPDRKPGARRLTRIRALMAQKKIRCVFREPQFPPKLVNVIVRGTGAKVGVLDPLGAKLKPGRDAYFQLMENMVTNMTKCLG